MKTKRSTSAQRGLWWRLCVLLVVALLALTSSAGSVFAEPEISAPDTAKPDATEEEEEEPPPPDTSIDRSVFEKQLPEGFHKVAENGRFRLYMEDKEYNLAVEDIRSGSFWYTSPPERAAIEGITGAGGLAAGSHLIVSYFDTSIQSMGSVNSLLGAVRQETVKVQELADGVRIDFDFSRKKEGFSIPLEVRLTETGIAARVLFDEIREYTEVLITDIAVLPYFGTGTTADNGYLLIPDGSGGVVEFNTGRLGMEAFSREVYGRDLALTTIKKTGVSEEILLPVYGIRKNAFGMVAYAAEGAGTSILTASPAGINGPLNYAYMAFSYRKTDNIVLADATWTPRDVVFLARSVSQRPYVEMRYDFLGTQEATVGGMAATYRQHLIQKGLTPLTDNTLYTYANVYGAVKKKKYFLGIPYTSIQALTSFDQAAEIAEFFQDGLDAHMLLQYCGALKGGMDDAVPIKAAFESKLGGGNAFRKLLESAQSGGYTVLPDIEFLRISKQRFGWWNFQVGAKNISRDLLTESNFQTSVFFRSGYRCNLLAAHKLLPAMQAFLKSAGKYPLTGLATGSLGNTVYSNFDAQNTADEDTMIAAVQEALQAVDKQYGNVMISGGADYAALYADHITDVAVSDSGYDIVAYRVPFYQMVLSGYVHMASKPLNGSANYRDSFLLCIETGTAPNFVFTYEDTDSLENTAYEKLTSTKFSAWQTDAKEAYARYAQAFSGITDRRIVGYEVLGNKLRKTTYGDGTAIFVNYDKAPVTVDGLTVPAKDFVVQSRS